MSTNLFNKAIVKRYAKAFFSLAKKHDLKEIEKDLENIKNLLENDTSFHKLIFSSYLKTQTQILLLNSVLKNNSFSNITNNFFLVLAQNKRLSLLPAIIDEFFNYLAELNGEMKVEVTSAEDLTQEQIVSITKSLENLYNKKVNLDLKIEEKILGGLIIKIGSKMLDNSLSNQLNRLKNITKEAILQN